jgi:acyl-CoA synthetase (AMP-forming)/AMP-acid ligase II
MPDKIAYRIPGAESTCGAAQEWTYRQLLSRVRAIGRHLRHGCRPGTAVLLAHPPGPEFLAALLGCAYGEMIAVPVDGLASLTAIAAHCNAPVMLTTRAAIAAGRDQPDLRVLATDAGSPRSLASLRGDLHLPYLAPDTPLMLQYQPAHHAARNPATITHSDLMNAVQRSLAAQRIDQQSEITCWLPARYTPDLPTALLCPLIAGKTATILKAASGLNAA